MHKDYVPRVFLSHSSKDKEFVEKLAKLLSKDGHSVWYDDWEIKVGDSIIKKIEEGISSSDFLIIVLSHNSINSQWVKKELNAATIRDIDSKGVFILPILIEKCQIPPLLSDLKYADFSKNFDAAYHVLIAAIKHHSGTIEDEEIVPIQEKTIHVATTEDGKTVETRWLDLLEDGNSIKIKRRLNESKEIIKGCFYEIIELKSKSASEDLSSRFWSTMDGLIIQLATLIEYDIDDYRNELLAILQYAYHLTAGPDASSMGDYPRGQQAEIWLGIASRVYSVAAISLKAGSYAFVRKCIEVEPSWSVHWAPRYWARHALTMYARSKRNNNQKEGLVAFANGYINESEWLRNRFDHGADEILDTLCGFDLLQCIIVVNKNKEVRACFPSFAQFYNHRINRVLTDIVNKTGSYEVISGIPDNAIASILKELDSYASNEYSFYSDWVPGLWPEEVKAFLAEHSG